MLARSLAAALVVAAFGVSATTVPATAEAEASASEAPAPVTVGSQLPPLTLEDQHGESRTLDASTRLVIFTGEMQAGDLVKEVLAERGGEILAERDAVYVADVHRMPALVRRLFALPSLRKRPYPMWLDTEGDATASFPAVEGRPTLLFVDDLVVREIRNPASADELRAALGLPPEAPEPD